MKLLVVEDSALSRELIEQILSPHYQIEMVPDLLSAQGKLSHQAFDLILLDIHLQNENGMQFFAQVSNTPAFKNVPVIFLTGSSNVEDKVMAFGLGAADYIVKPFAAAELLARVQARLNQRIKPQEDEMINIGAFTVRLQSQRVFLKSPQNDLRVDEIHLSPIEYRLLLFFIKNPGRIYSRNQIFDAVWGENTHYLERTVDRHISTLKKKLSFEQLKSVYSMGYIFKP